MQMREMGEFNFIKSVADDTIYDMSTVICGIGDDCAVYKAKKGYHQLVSTDMMVEGIHFSSKTTAPFDIGYRLGTANISDIAAMGFLVRLFVFVVCGFCFFFGFCWRFFPFFPLFFFFIFFHFLLFS